MKNSQDKKRKSSIKTGQIWQLGDHRLLCGSSLDATLVKKLIGNTRINAVITDPPYGVSYTQSKEGFSAVKVNKRIVNDDISTEGEYVTFTKAWLVPVLPHLIKKNSIYIFNCDKMLFALKDALDQLHVYFSQLIIWVKNHAVIGRKDYLPQHELIVFGWFGRHAFRRSKDKSVLFYPKPNKSSRHPTQKPIPLVRHLVLNATNVGDVVYEPFAGSGTTLICCEQTKRRCFAGEVDLEYCAGIISYWEKMSGQKAKLL
ncbi:MAG: methylase N-4/N-6 domain protein [Candidatus Uhrbacteria bacterium GW2011_GWE2_45_35]|uniref:Methylase N-4/N-6 domain protein n=1 Tax=Candidatus Uhrbacteria bacterium GW2011_GWE2_45_35 TaxID=1618993 RepID=A0A0G1ML30_9BACT|nr:MAG: methylase N-4/N-6 domain protein [Candidatus Uhrbacteria bacterium GW2011_GWE2_45_35]